MIRYVAFIVLGCAFVSGLWMTVQTHRLYAQTGISDGRNPREPLGRHVRPGLDRARFLLSARPGRVAGFRREAFFSSR
jgi:hypothetical protein